MQLQVELYNAGDRRVYWLHTCCEENTTLTPGRRLVLEEEPSKSWTIVRTFVGLSDDAELPLKAQKGTIFCMLEDDGTADVQAAFPQIFVCNSKHGF